MPRPKWTLFLAAAVLAAGAAGAEGAEGDAVDPGGDSLVMRAPEGWVPAHEDRSEALYELVFLPADQTLDDWQQKLTIQAFLNLTKRRPELSPADFAENLARHWNQSCDRFGASPISAFQERGYATAVRLLFCPRNRGGQVGSVSMIKIMQGRASMYMFERSWRGPAYPVASLPVEQDSLDEWAEFLAATTLCNPDNADAPCAQGTR